MRRFFCGAPNFAKDSIDNYRRSLCSMSPGVFNAAASSNGSRAFVIEDFASISSIPKLVVAGGHDKLVSYPRASVVGEAPRTPHLALGGEWGVSGVRHLRSTSHGFRAI